MLRPLSKFMRTLQGQVRVVGRPLHKAEYLEAGVCRLRWVGVAGLLINVVGLILFETGAVSTLKDLWVSPLAAMFFGHILPIVTMLAFLLWAHGTMTIRSAQWLCGVTLFVFTLPPAILVGITGLSSATIPNMTLALMICLILVPLGIAGQILISLMTISVAVTISLIMQSHKLPPETGQNIGNLWFPLALSGAGITINTWYARSWRQSWLTRHNLGRQKKQIERQRREVETMLRAVLPEPVIHELNQTGGYRSNLEEACVISVDITRFSDHCTRLPAAIVVEQLRLFFRAFDRCCAEQRIEPLRGGGDGALGIGGLWPDAKGGKRRPVIDAILAMLAFRNQLGVIGGDANPNGECNASLPRLWSARIGIHFGPVMMGVIRGLRMSFDVWGETVNNASRLQQGAATNSIMISGAALWATRGLFEHSPIRELRVKNTVLPAAAELVGIAAPYRNHDGTPNQAFWNIYHAVNHPLTEPPAAGTIVSDRGPLRMSGA